MPRPFSIVFWPSSQHAFIELAIPVSVFGAGAMLNSVRWAPGCNNDYVMTDFGTKPDALQYRA